MRSTADRISDSLRRRGGEESGVVLVLVAGMLVIILGAAGLALDLGSFYKAQRQAQAAADAGALAAGDDLPTGTSAAATDATNYASTNYPGSTVNVTTNYNNTPGQVKVTVSANTPSFFGQVFGMTKAKVSATAVAGSNGGGSNAAVFASDTTCGSGHGVTMTGDSSLTINGGVDSNGSLQVSGDSSINLGPTTYGGPQNCSDTVTGNSAATFASGPTPRTNTYSWPKDYSSIYPSACTVTGTSFHWDSSSSANIPRGVYCATGAITITGNSSLTGTDVTLIANSITITGNSSLTLTPDTPDLPSGYGELGIYQTGTGTCSIQGSSISNSTVFVPNGTLSIVGTSSGSATGYLEAQDVTISGDSSFVLNGNGPSASGSSGASLIQ